MNEDPGQVVGEVGRTRKAGPCRVDSGSSFER